LSELEAADGTSIYYEVHGATGPAVIFSCAYTTTHVNWRPQVEPLTEAGARVVLWDFRGHGLSGVPAESSAYDMARVVDDLGRVADLVSPDEPVVLAGLSFGGLASLHYAVEHLDRTRALVLAGSGPGFKKAEAAAKWKQQSERTATYLEERGLEAFVDGKAAATCVGRRPELPAAKAALEAFIAQDPHGLAEFGRHVAGLAPSVIDELAGIDRPALVVVGSDDAAYLQAAEVMAAKLPDARHRVVEGAGHILNIEETAAFNALVIDFLREIEILPAE
jgi:pimeloyl-ACP methyl ester carboxylesterase